MADNIIPESKLKQFYHFAGKIRETIKGHEIWLILLGMVIIASMLTPNFFTVFNIRNLLNQTSIYGILAIGQFLVILSGGFDLSVAAVMAFSSVFIATNPNGNIYLILLLTTLIGLGFGILNGLSITFGKVPPLIATLAVAGIARGLAFNTTPRAIFVDVPLLNFLRNSIWVFSYSTIIWILLIIIFSILISVSRTGNYIYAVGGNQNTAKLAGIKSNRIILIVYMLSGMLSGIAGILFVVRSSSGVPHVGVGWELDTIAAVLIGGTRISGGVGKLTSAMAGILAYMLIRNALNIIGFDPFFQDIIKAIVILIAVGLSQIQFKK